MKNLVVISAVLLVLSGCGTSKTLKSIGWSKKGCPLERLDWMKVSAGYDSKTMLEIASKLELAAQSDIKQINGNAQVKGEFTSSLNDIINRSGSGEIQVSQEFYEAYINKRSAICSVYQGIKDGIIKGDEAKKKAGDLYLELAKSFSDYKTIEEKKNQH